MTVTMRTLMSSSCCQRIINFSRNTQLKVLQSFFSTEHKLKENQLEDAGEKINPLEHPDYFGVSKLFTVKDLFEARVHFGHKEGSLDNRMKPFLLGSRLGHLIFDLDKTADYLRQALNFTAHVAFRDGIILFVAQSPQNGHLIEKTAQEVSEFAHTRFWRQGMFTNSTMLYGAMTRLPDLCIVLNTLTTVMDQHLVISESAKMAIPTIAIVDSNCNPNLVTYPVPGNDDTPSAIALYCNLFKSAILIGKEHRKKALESSPM